MRGIVLIPAFNEGKIITRVISKVPEKIFGNKLDVVVVDDGSIDNTAKAVRGTRAKLISHPINRGLGAALGTGFEYARSIGYDFLVTLDADGQHDPQEIGKLVKPVLNKKADFVVGTRFKKVKLKGHSKQGMYFSRKILTFFASIATYIFSGVWTSDSQSGFRAFSKRAIDGIFIETDRMEVSTDFFRQCKEKNFNITERIIKPIYTDYSIEKGQHFLNSFNIIGKLALKRILK